MKFKDGLWVGIAIGVTFTAIVIMIGINAGKEDCIAGNQSSTCYLEWVPSYD